MNGKRFLELLKTFADDPDSLDQCRSNFIISVRDQLIEFSVNVVDGNVFVTENDVKQSAETWIFNRLANLRILAQRILEVTPRIENYIPPSGLFVDVLERSPGGEESSVDNAFLHLQSELSKGAGLSSYVIYLTSDAGEGKTTTIQELAITRAESFLKSKTGPLVVPIYLGGQPFIRLDDMIIGSIANTYRFSNLYIDSFSELVKLGAIIPAFDGFEEMFVVGSSGEAVSSLGNFVANLESSGTTIVSARTAYFEIRDFSAQARLFDGMNHSNVAFSRLKLNRWNKERFLNYWDLRCLEKGEQVWDELSHKFNSAEHPLLTRAVLVKKLADIAEDAEEFHKLIQRIGADASTYFGALIDSIIERELTKWLDRREAKVSRPILTIEEHHELLSNIAAEMSSSSDAEISNEELNIIAEVYCEEKNLDPSVSRQVLARIPDHPLLRKTTSKRNTLVFDHEEFRDFFTGESIARMLIERRTAEFKTLMRNAVITPSAAESCFIFIKEHSINYYDIVDFLKTAMKGEESASNIKESGSRILARILTLIDGKQIVEVSNCVFEQEAFKRVQLRNVEFIDCFFHRLDLRSSILVNCKFYKCEINAIEWDEHTKIKEVSISADSTIFEAHDDHADFALFDPAQIAAAVKKIGFQVEVDAAEKEGEKNESTKDLDLSLTERVLRAFHRSNGVTDHVLKVRLGKHYSYFSGNVLPELLKAGILDEGDYRGQGQQDLYHLGSEMTSIERAMRTSRGNFSKFIEILKKVNTK